MLNVHLCISSKIRHSLLNLMGFLWGTFLHIFDGTRGSILVLSGLQWATASERWQEVGVSWAVRGRSIRNCWHKFPLDQALDHTQSVRDTKAEIHLTSAHQIFPVKVWSLFLLHSNYVLLSLRISFIFPLIVNRADSHKINITIGGRLNSSIFNFLRSYTKLPELSLFSIQDLGNLHIGIFFPQVKVF